MRSTKSVWRPVLAAIVSAGVVVAAAGCASSDPGDSDGSNVPDVKIGVVAALTGYLAASSDVPFVEGVKLAVEAINANGGAAGHKLAITVVDDASDAGTGVTAANKLIAQDNVGVLMGGSLSAQCSGLSPVAVSNQIPMTCIAPAPAEGFEYTFQVAAGLGPMIAAQLGYAKKLGAKTVAFLYSQTPYGQAGAKVLSILAPNFGIEVGLTEGVDSNSSDLAPLMAKVKDSKPDAVLDFLTGPVHIVEAKGAATAQLDVPIIQTTDVTSVFRKSAAEYPNLYFVVVPPQAYPSINDEALKAANEALASAYKGDPDGIGQVAYGWDAVHVLAAAVEKSGAVTGPDLRAALESLSYQGTLSAFAYSAEDHSGEKTVANPNAIAHFVGGKLEVVYWADGSEG